MFKATYIIDLYFNNVTLRTLCSISGSIFTASRKPLSGFVPETGPNIITKMIWREPCRVYTARYRPALFCVICTHCQSQIGPPPCYLCTLPDTKYLSSFVLSVYIAGHRSHLYYLYTLASIALSSFVKVRQGALEGNWDTDKRRYTFLWHAKEIQELIIRVMERIFSRVKEGMQKSGRWTEQLEELSRLKGRWPKTGNKEARRNFV